MKKLTLGLLFLGLVFDASAGADLRSTVKGISIENTHLLYRGKNGSQVLRGAAPADMKGVLNPKQIQELADYGITDVVVFKNQLNGEVDNEIQALVDAGIKKRNIKHIPFLWKNIEDQTESCKHIVQAIQKIKDTIKLNDRKIFFHCTVGQDRTGLLAGIFEMLKKGKNKRDVFDNQMCGHGYEAGNSEKPENVVSMIRSDLTPVFLKLANYIEKQNLSLQTIAPRMCRPAMKAELTEDLSDWQCR